MKTTIIIGETALRFHCPTNKWERLIRARYAQFIGTRRSALEVVIESGTPAPAPALSVEHGRNWQIARSDFFSVTSGDFSSTRLRCDRNRYSFDSWLRVFFSLYALPRGGLLLHASGIRHAHTAHLFAGRSGAGKSTMIRILGKQDALSDELVYVYRRNGRFLAACTPFWGELKRGIRTFPPARLGTVNLLAHGKTLAIDPLPPPEALRRLLQSVLYFTTDPQDMRRILALGESLLATTAFRRLTFARTTPRGEILDRFDRRNNIP